MNTLLNAIQQVASPEELYGVFISYLAAQGYQPWRTNLAVRTIHPQLSSYVYTWNRLNEVKMGSARLHLADYQLPDGTVISKRGSPISDLSSPFLVNSPIPSIINEGAEYHFNIEKLNGEYRFPVLKDLQDHGCTGYIALPVRHGKQIIGFFSVATDKPNGYNDKNFYEIKKSLALFSLAWIAAMRENMLSTLMSFYLGPQTASKLLQGQIVRGDVSELDAIIWFSDIRGYTQLTANHNSHDVIAWLNDYYDMLIQLIHYHNGEVLKLMGDGLLAVFPIESENYIVTGIHYALRTAKLSNKILKRANRRRVRKNLPAIEHGIGLHHGKVQYGNIGSRDRLDFTVIGPAVNLTSRIASLCGTLGKPVLVSATIAREVTQSFVSQGRHQLKGIAEPVEIFAPLD